MPADITLGVDGVDGLTPHRPSLPIRSEVCNRALYIVYTYTQYRA